ncbi:unnamed protein product [Fusarium graminearum]|uniref:Uncharacterized protein n=1 Tax=Gibberella zeae TaxID=5518 RepID=A0A4U9EMC0_GIBZA|nr:unnamed protein product [Fusarium graminearum]CAF3639847.1 unnamed protein product [Fusarium graminearum]CAG1989565.1 unnamed protein product [Fusarium graminearum]CAG1997382.1 unnamed protein product [Fusarium graminearum]VTO83229.1 unnamed protein product [Fusarium graminearum]
MVFNSVSLPAKLSEPTSTTCLRGILFPPGQYTEFLVNPVFLDGLPERSSLLVDTELVIFRRRGRRAVRATIMTEMQISAVAQISKILLVKGVHELRELTNGNVIVDVEHCDESANTDGDGDYSHSKDDS